MNSKKTLIIRINSEAKHEWALLDAKHALCQEPEINTLAEIAEKAEYDNIIVLLPSINFLFTTTAINSKKRSHLQQAIPFVVEEALINEVEDNYFYLLAQKEQQQYVSVIKRKYLDAVLSDLDAAGLYPSQCIPELFLLPTSEKTWHVVLEDYTVTIRTDTWTGFACDTNNFLPVLIEKIHQGTDVPDSICIVDHTDGMHPITKKKQLEEIHLEQKIGDKSVLKNLLSSNAIPAVNILPPSLQKNKQSITNKRLWQLVTLLGTLTIGSWTSTQIIQHSQLRNQQQLLTKKIAKLYFQVFPQASSVISPKIRLQRALAKSSKIQNQALWNSLITIGSIIKTVDNAQLTSIDFSNNQLAFTVETLNKSSLKKLEHQLATQSIKIKKKVSSKHGNKIIGHFIIEVVTT